ncbi:MAG: tetratricopeptide repeat protein [Pirellulales bacterium]|nr:tetratricopeptide repeat protein [Pirellulales bacterium]
MSVAVRQCLLPAVVACIIVASATLLSAGTADDQYAVAAAHYAQGRWQLAVKEFQAFLQKHPGDSRNNEAVYYLGDALLQLGKHDEARAKFRDCLAREPAERFARAALFRLGEAAYLAGDYKAAKADLDGFRTKYPEDQLNAFVLPYLGEIALAGGEADSAAKFFGGALDRFPKGKLQDDCRLGLARALAAQNRTDEAAKLFFALAEKDDGLLADAAQYHLGALHFGAGNHSRAIECFAAFDARFSRSPWRPNARLGRGLALLKLDRPAEAAIQFDAVLADAAAGGELLQRALRGKVEAALQMKDHEAVDRLVSQFERQYPGSSLLGGVRRLAACSLIERKRYAEAIPLWEAFLAEKPSGDIKASALGGLAICCARAGQIEKAKKYHAELIEMDPKSPFVASITEQLAEAAYEAADAAWSEELSKRLTALGTAKEYDIKGKLGLGWSQYKAGKLAEAALTFEDLLKGGKTLPPEIAAEAAFTSGRILEELGRDKDALIWYDFVAQNHPTSKQHRDALWAAAQLHGKLKLPRQASQYYERLAKDYPQSPKLDSVLYEWAWALLDLGEAETARRTFQRIHAEFPQSRFWADATCRAAQLALEKKDRDRANELIEKLLESKADQHVKQHALELRGQAAVADDDWPKVREAFETLLREYPESPRRLVAECWIAEAHYRQGNFDSAEAMLEQLAEKVKQQREPWMAMVPLRRGQILARQNRWNDAYLIAAQIETDFPDFSQQYEVDYLLGRCLASRADFQAARRAYNKVIDSPAGAKTETAAMAQWMIGETYFHQKDFEAAIREYLRLEAIYAYPTWQAGALLQAGKCHERLGRPEQAKMLYRRILELYPWTDFAERAKDQLHGLK